MNFISRAEAGLRPPKSIDERALSDIDGVMFHYSAMEASADCKAQWKTIQKYHMESNEWSDVGYHFGICLAHGHVLVGRGIKRVGAHCPNFNTSHVGIVFLTDDDKVRELTPQAKRAAVELVKWVEGKAGKDLPAPKGHRDGKATTCPGDEVYDWLKAGMPVPSAPPASGSRPEPVAQPSEPKPAPRPAPDKKDVFVIELELPVLRFGDRGKKVKLLQRLLGGLSVDGVFGNDTRTRVKVFQVREGLDNDGVVGPLTWTELLK